MKRLLTLVLVAVLITAGGCSAGGPGADPDGLASGVACPPSTGAISEPLAKALAAFGRGHCNDTLAALPKEYVTSDFRPGSSRALSSWGCLVEGSLADFQLVEGTQYCFVHMLNAGGNIFAAMPATDRNPSNEDVKPVFFVAAEPGLDHFWVYSPKGGIYGASDSVARVRSDAKGGSGTFVETVYLPTKGGRWQKFDDRLIVNSTMLRTYARDFLAFLRPHVP